MGLKKLISQGESETLEFKKSLRLKDEIGESISAFSNSNGRVILNTNQRISSSEIRRLAKESGGKSYWDEQICEGVKLEDIDWGFVKNFFIPGKVGIKSLMSIKAIR